jgi:hypothetical protein
MATQPQLSEHDKLITRPAEELPTPLDPASRQARHADIDPKQVPSTGQGDPDATDPAPDDIGRTV